jgi:Mitochondrial 39-S ribosomal protein L47 (MRP-L47)
VALLPPEKIDRAPQLPYHLWYTPFQLKLIVGRAWEAEELRRKSWEDLHILWYKCILDRNIMATEWLEAKKQRVAFGLVEQAHNSRKIYVRVSSVER